MPVDSRIADSDAPQVPVCILAPEEFLALWMREVNDCQGKVVDVRVESGNVSLRATLPMESYEALLKEYAAESHIGRIVRE